MKNTDIFSITTDEEKLHQLFDSMDFEKRGGAWWLCLFPGLINYSEFLAACLARKEGLRREYAELIFKLWVEVFGLRLALIATTKD